MFTKATGAAALLAACVLTEATAQTDWRRLPLLAHHSYGASAWDAARGRLVLFGGDSAAGLTGSTWEWDGSDWQQAHPVHAPSPRKEVAAAYDPLRGVVVLFGGRTAAGVEADTWEWNGVDWNQRTPATSPSARRLHAMTWDGGRQRVLLFGGREASFSELDDTWEWDGVNWSPRSPLHRPPGRTGTAMAWDATRDRVVLFGGSCFALGPCYRWDTWEWNGTDWTDHSLPWQQSPPPRWSHSMVFDSGRNRVLMFGGSDEPGHYKGDTWEWDGVAWTELLPAHQPVNRLGHGMVYDPATQHPLVVGGASFFGLVSDVWALDAGDWQLVHPGSQPNSGLYATFDAAWDGDSRGVLWFGVGIAEAPLPQTWLWNGRWTLVSEDQGPQWPEQHRLQWLPGRQRMILHQPELYSRPEQTWEFDGTAWQPIPTNNLPGAGAGFALALDPHFDRLVLFGGRYLSNPPNAETWLFDGVDWTAAAPVTSPPRATTTRWRSMRRAARSCCSAAEMHPGCSTTPGNGMAKPGSNASR